MTVKTTLSLRYRFLLMHQEGLSYPTIAERCNVSRWCVRYWCRRLRKEIEEGASAGGRGVEGEGAGVRSVLGVGLPDGGKPQSNRAPQMLVRFDAATGPLILQLHSQHPGWGPHRIQAELATLPLFARRSPPSPSTIQRFLARQNPAPRPKAAKPPPVPKPPQPLLPFDCWQVDMKVEIPLDDGTLATLVTVRDVAGAVCVAADVVNVGTHRPGQAGRGKRLTQVQLLTVLRQGFLRYGVLPRAIQTDGEALFIGHPERLFPSPFLLWCLGMGITHRQIQPGRPTQNGAVERAHQTLMREAILGNTHLSLPALCHTLQRALDRLASTLPSRASGCHGLPPHQAHPELLQPELLPGLSAYDQVHELERFDLERVDAHLAQFVWRRVVNVQGQVNLGVRETRYLVGKAWAGQTLLARFDPADRTHVFHLDPTPGYALSDPRCSLGAEIVRRPVRRLSKEDLCGFALMPVASLPTLQYALPLVWSTASLQKGQVFHD